MDPDDQLGVAHRLDEDVLGAAPERLLGPLRRRLAGLHEQDGGAEGVRVALDALEQALPRLRVHHRDVRPPFTAAIEGLCRAVALGHLVSGLGQDSLEPVSLPRPPVGYDNTHVDSPNTRKPVSYARTLG